MLTYRIFPLSAEGHIVGPATIVEAPDDFEAAGVAREKVEATEAPMEVWQSGRLVERIDPIKHLVRAAARSGIS